MLKSLLFAAPTHNQNEVQSQLASWQRTEATDRTHIAIYWHYNHLATLHSSGHLLYLIALVGICFTLTPNGRAYICHALRLGSPRPSIHSIFYVFELSMA